LATFGKNSVYTEHAAAVLEAATMEADAYSKALVSKAVAEEERLEAANKKLEEQIDLYH
jgi:hypothetical protein